MQKVRLQSGQKKFLLLKKLKILFCEHMYVIEDLKGEEIAGMFYENELQQTSQTEFGKSNKEKRW